MREAKSSRNAANDGASGMSALVAVENVAAAGMKVMTCEDVSETTYATYPRGFLREGNKNISLNSDMLIILLFNSTIKPYSFHLAHLSNISQNLL